MANSFGALAGGGGDPRLSIDQKAGFGSEGMIAYTRPQMRALHDPSVQFEEYHYYAKLTRELEETTHVDPGATRGIMSTLFPSKSSKGVGIVDQHNAEGANVPEKSIAETANINRIDRRASVTDEEWVNASRAVRTATWSACFYLITTDILGPYGLPYAIATTGWGPGIVLYTVFGALAGYGGYLLWQMFLGLDSYQYPMKHYGDMAFRIYGRWARYGFNILQSIQLIASVAIISVSNGQALSQAAKFKLCYSICILVLVLAGMIVGQIRTLQKFGWLANFAVWINLLIIFITMGVAAHSPPNYSGAQSASAGASLGSSFVSQLPDGSYPPVMHSGGLPDAGNFIGAVNGLMQAVYAYGGAMLFTEFMAEMKRPRDFIKAMWGAQFFIWICYMLYGLFMYGYQGQYACNPSYLGISPYGWQTTGNVLAIVSALIAAALYGNIGIKVLYNNVFVELFHAPPLTHRNGKIAWAVMVPIYWAIAYVLGASIPNFSGLVGIISAFCIIQFTYTFPPMLHMAYRIKVDSMLPGDGFNPTTGQIVRGDGGMKRIIRGFSKFWWLNTWNLIYMLGALVTAGLGAYSAIELIIEAFKSPVLGAFNCHSPLDDASLG